MPFIDRWLEYLSKMRIRYAHSIHPWAETAFETAEAERMPAHEFAKTVVYFSDGGFGIAVVPADQIVDLASVGRLQGCSYVRLANETELAALYPDCEVGAMPPFGGLSPLPVVLDSGLVNDSIAFTIGSHRDIVRMSFEDFQKLANPKIAPIGINEPFIQYVAFD